MVSLPSPVQRSTPRAAGHFAGGQNQKELHSRASKWFEKNGFAEEAIHQALAAGDYPEAARQVEAAAENAWLNGQCSNILSWIKALPISLVHSRPWLCIWCAWAYTLIGISEDIQEWLEAAEQSSWKRSSRYAGIDA